MAAATQSSAADERSGRRRAPHASATWWWVQVGAIIALLLAVTSTTRGMHSKQSLGTPAASSREDSGSTSSDWDFGFAPEGGTTGGADVGGVASPPMEVDRDTKRASVKRLWGVPDVTAVVGRPFRLDVPKDAFTGHVERYEVYGPGKSPLPQWLALMDPRHGRMEGVPGPSDVGELYVTLKAVAPSKKDMDEYELPEMAKDVFVIEVLPSPPWPSSANGKGVCISPLLVSVVLDADFNHLGAQSRARVVGVASSTFLSVTPGSLMLRSQNRDDKPDPSDGSVLAAGPGDASPMSRSAKRGSVLEWQIGCNGHIWQWKEKDAKGSSASASSSSGDWREVSGESVAELRRHARDGSLSDILGLPVVGWRVRRVGADGRPHSTMGHEGGRVARAPSHRVRREWGSGDFENGDDEEDEEGEEELPKMWTEPWDGDYGFEEKTAERVPETRIIPTMASPVFAEPTAVTIGSMGDSSHPHRHHHGEGEEEEDEEEDYGPYASVASGRNVLVTSPVPVYGTILPTPVLVPVRPTRFLGMDEDGNTIEASHFDELAGVIDATPSLSLMLASSHFAPSMSSPSITPSPTLWPTTPSATVDTSDLSPVVTEPLLPTTSKDSVDDMSSSTSSAVTEDYVSSENSLEVPRATSPSRPGSSEEEIVIDIKNFPPTIHHRLRKIPVTAGNPLRYVIPDDIFTDLEDGSTRNLKLNFKTTEGEPVSPSSWVQFNPDTQEVYALPLEEHVSKWDFTVEAVDREGASVSDTLEVLVQHHKGRRTFHHEFSLVLQLEKKYNFPSDVDWQLRVFDGLRRVFDDDSIVVTSVGHQSASGQAPSYADTLVFSWTNDSLPRTDCPAKDIEKLFKILALNDAGEPSTTLRDVLSPEFKVKRVSFKGSGQCEGIGAGEEATPPVKHVPKGPGEKGKEDSKVPPVVPPKAGNTAPYLRNQVDHINATVGKLLVFKVPEDTFYDEEDGSTRNLELSLLTMDRTPIPPSHWLQFDQRNQEFFGVPFTQDKGWKDYQLVCKDSGGLTAHDALRVAVHDIPAITASTRRRPLLPNQQLPTAHSFHSVEFVATLLKDHETFDSSPSLKRKFVERLAHLFGDRETSSIMLYSITAGEDDGVVEDGERGTTLISWFNTSLAVDRCPNKDVSRLRNILVAENGGPGMKEVSLSQHVQTTFGFELPIRSIDIIPINTCLGELPVIHFPESPPSILEEDEEDGRDNGPSSTTSSSSDEYLITFIVPAVVIAAMLLLAGLIACILYRRRRRGKLSVAEKRAGGISGGPLLAGANRGIPVIFQDELEERPPDPAKSPVIMKDEKPPLPLPPPEYQMAPNGGGGGGGTRGGGPQGGGMMAEPHTGTPLLSQGPRHQGSGSGGGGGGPRRRGRGRDEGGGGSMMMHGRGGMDEDPGERGALMGGGRGGGMGMHEDEGAGDDDGDRGMVPVGGASSPPYHPPPPFTTNRDSGRGSRPKPTPTYRKPPPYVPP